MAPEVVDHDVDIGGGPAESLGDRVGIPFEQYGTGGAECGQVSQSVGTAPGGDNLVCAEQFRDLDGHLAGVTGGTEDEDILSGPELHPLAQRDPGGHGRVHGGGDRDGVAAGGQDDAAADVDDGLFSHRAHRGIREDEVAQ